MQTVAPEAPASARPAADAVIRVSNVSKRFGKAEPTVHDLSFEVQRGEIFCLLGPSGSGKSTTLRMLTGVYTPSDGKMEVLGVEPHRFNKRIRARIGYMPQQFVLFPELTTRENVNFVASVYGMSWFGRGRRMREALEFVDLWEARNRRAGQLSGGMQRRLELASVLIHRPDVLFVDEPTAGIDPILRAKFWEQFKALRDMGRTLFVTTQYVTEADYCDKVAILNRGRLLALGTPEEVRRQAQNGEVVVLELEEVTSPAVRILRGIPGMKRVHIVTTEEVRLTVDNAAEAIPQIVTAFQQNNIAIVGIEPYRPNFEEIFVQLLEADNAPDETAPKLRSATGKERERARSSGPKPGTARVQSAAEFMQAQGATSAAVPATPPNAVPAAPTPDSDERAAEIRARRDNGAPPDAAVLPQKRITQPLVAQAGKDDR